jgi:Response regulators consisting of a CheY-like receiver domain and a winged-helix DNA-binding domain
MKVLVCDDDDKFLKIIREYLQQIGSEQNLQLEILGIQNPDELMEQVKKNPDIQLIFLDIIFEGSENNGTINEQVRDFA